MNSKYLISIVGPTAIGKTALSLKLANHFKTEILSADSRQFFKEMSIGTAAPTPSELALAKHHFIHHKSIDDDYNVGTFERDAINLLDQLFKKYDVIIMVGGSGLYVDAVINGLDDFPAIDTNIRESLNIKLDAKGLEALQQQLKELDQKSYDTIAINNPHRIIRALEVTLGTGKPYSSYLNKKKTLRCFKSIMIGLTADRKTIYDRINRRVDEMMQNGLLKEVENLLPNKHLNALNTVGYKELFHYFDGEWSLEFAISEIKKNSRRFAKRQLTWYRKNEGVIWFEYDSDIKDILNIVNKRILEDENN